MTMCDRIVVLIDMDCFYCQVETKLNPKLRDKPLAVVQYNSWKGGGIIAVNYEARARGVNRYMRGDEAQKHCPEIELVRVATLRDKADLSKYRDASRDVFDVLCKYCDCVEKASIDEAYLDVTSIVNSRASASIESSQLSNTFIVGYTPDDTNEEDSRSEGTSCWVRDVMESGNDADRNLAFAGILVEEIRAKIFEVTGFRCSAGIAHNKILAKLVCGLHKPNRQTILPHSSVPHLYSNLSIKKVRNLGGKFGDTVMAALACKTMADLEKFSLLELQNAFDHKNGLWLYNIARGLDDEPVKARLIAKSIGCCKRFPGKNCLSSEEKLKPWLMKLSDELNERITSDQITNKRRATLMTVSATLGSNYQSTSKAVPFPVYSTQKIYDTAFMVIRKLCIGPDKAWAPVYCLGISAGKFISFSSKGSLDSFLKSVYSCEYFNSVSGKENAASETELKNEEGYFTKFITKETVCSNDPEKETITNLNESKDKGNVESAKVSHKETKKSGIEVFLSSSEQLSDTARNAANNDADNAVECKSDKNNYFSKFLESPENKKSPLNRSSSYEDIFGGENELKEEIPSTESDQKIELQNKGFIKTVTSEEPLWSVQKSLSPGQEGEPYNFGPGAVQKTNEKTITTFLSGPRTSHVSLEEIFPDINAIDDDLLLSLPVSFRNKVIGLRKEGGNKKSPEANKNNELAGRNRKEKVLNKSSNTRFGKSSTSNKPKILDMLKPSTCSKPSTSGMKSISNSLNNSCFSPIKKSTTDTIHHSTDGAETSLSSGTNWCSKCNREILEKFAEHSDRHVAEELDALWNKRPITSVQASVFSHKIQPKTKKVKIDNKMKNIKSFFSKK